MDKYVFIIVIICASTQSSPANKQYRFDYEYSRKTDAFYKLHTESRPNRRAQVLCEAEGASLVLPTPEDIQQIHVMLKKFPDLGPMVLVASDGNKHESLEEEAMINLEPEQQSSINDCDVVTRSGDVESVPCWRSAPFVCKVAASDAHYDEQCGVYAKGKTQDCGVSRRHRICLQVHYDEQCGFYAKGYISKISTTGSCYKIPNLAFTWNEAYAQCVAEGAHLVVLNTEGEHQEVKRLIQRAPDVSNARFAHYYFAGIRANRPKNNTPRVFKTVLNQTLEEAGYAGWSANEPNNFMDNEYCGTLFRNDGKYNDLGCAFECGYVCEKERRVVK